MENDINIVPDEIFEQFLHEDDWMEAPYEESMLNFDDEMEYPEYTIRINGAECGPVTGIMCLSGQSGNGKTQTSTLVMSVYLGAQIQGIELIWNIQPRVLYVDTEMEKGNTQLVVARIARLCNKSIQDLKEKLHVMRLRDEDDHMMIWRKILRGIFELMPDVVVLDGMIDIIGDFNDNKESSRIIRKIMKIADHYRIPIWTVMHQNPGTNKMVGHEGSFIERKSTMVLHTKKVEDNKAAGIYHFEVENQKQRGQDIIPLMFHMEKFSLPNGRTNAYPVIGKSINDGAPEAEQEPDYSEFVRRVIPKEGITTRDLRLAVEKEYKVGHTKADELMWKLEDDKYVIRDKNKRYFIGTDVEQMSIEDVPEEDAPF